MSQSTDRFSQLEAALTTSGLELFVSEVHGTVVGAIANHMKSGVTPDLFRLIAPDAQADSTEFTALRDILYELYRENSELLLEGKESFDLLLPDDDDSIAFRADSLAAWARGYMLGLLYNNAFSIDQLPESGAEIARDILQISEAEAGDDDEHEEDWALAELHEYVKVGAQLIFEFIYSERASKAPAQTQ